MSEDFDPNEYRDDLERETYGDYDGYDDYDDYDDYDGYDRSIYYDCPDVTIRNTVRKWFRAIKDRVRNWIHRNDINDIPF